MLTVTVGGQAGSEGKGAVTARLHRDRKYDFAVRVGGPNAGHTVVDDVGRRFALRQLPVAAVADPACTLVIAAGSEIDAGVLASEVRDVELAGYPVRGRLFVDREATLIDDDHQRAEMGITTGTTGKGVGGARAARALRRARRASEVMETFETQELLREELDSGADVMIEGTQGHMLGSHAGYYPHCTSGDCRAIDFMAAAGLGPQEAEIWVVLRSHPIRIAGESGPLPFETSWGELGLEPEYTTVTKKVRRVARWNYDWVWKSIAANSTPGRRPRVALTFADYWWPALAGRSEMTGNLRDGIEEEIKAMEGMLRADIRMLGTGPNTQIMREAARVSG